MFPQAVPYALHTPRKKHLFGLNYRHPLCNPSGRCKSYNSALLQQRNCSSAVAGVSRGQSAQQHQSCTGESTCEHRIHLDSLGELQTKARPTQPMHRPPSKLCDSSCHHLNSTYTSSLVTHQDKGTTGTLPICNPVHVLAEGIVLH